jgi:F-type H+-transporting ATPase subunit epsilon
VLLTESAEEASAIDLQRAEEAKKRAQERLAATTKDVDKERAASALERAQNRLRVAQKYKK